MSLIKGRINNLDCQQNLTNRRRHQSGHRRARCLRKDGFTRRWYEFANASALLGGPLYLATVPVNLAMALAAGLLVYYLLLDRVFAAGAAVLFGLLLWAAAATAAQGMVVGWSVFLIGQIVGWVAQIFGHHYYEGRQPALIDNLVQALVSAPIFIVADVFFFFGFRRDKAEAMHAAVADRGALRRN